MSNKYAVIESRWSRVYNTLKVRIWRQEEEIKDKYDNTDLDKAFDNWGKQFQNKLWKSIPQLVEALVGCGRVNAVEVLTGYGLEEHGFVVYPEWP
jgi:hypothetical protein